MTRISAIIPSHNPGDTRLRRCLAALRQQTLPPDAFETILIDNASTRFPEASSLVDVAPANLRLIAEAKLGLTSARRCGLLAAEGAIGVFIDDDNVLAPDYLERALEIMAAQPRLGALGGKSLPEFEVAPAAWHEEFFPLLALRDLGAAELISDGGTPLRYPVCAPIGAGMVLRRDAWQPWLARPTELSDRRGTELTSAGDNDIVLTVLRAGWTVGYSPHLSLTHLIPVGRLEPDYLARLNRGIQTSWMRVLTKHGCNPWPSLTGHAAALRKAKAWMTYRAWSDRLSHIRWQGACGHFDGRVP